MRETFWYFEYTAEQLEEIAEQSRLAQGGVSIDFVEPESYDGAILDYDDGGIDGSRLTNPTPIDQTPVNAGYIDIDAVVGVASADGTSISGKESGILRIEQHPSIYGTPLRIKFTCELQNGSVPTDGNIIVSTPYIWQNSLYVEVALILSPDSVITQEQLTTKLDSITYGRNHIILSSFHSNSTAPLVAFKSITEYNNDGDVYHDLCAEPKTYITTAGNPNAQLISGLPYIEGTFEQGRLLNVSLVDITDRDPVFPYSFQWYREESNGTGFNNVAIEGATNILYTVSSADVGKNLTVAVTYIDKAGDAAQSNSPPVYIINNLPTADLTIESESYRVGNIVYASIANVRDRNGVSSVGNYRWQRSNIVPLVSSNPWVPSWEDIADASSLNYEITSADQQRRLRFTIDVTDNLGDVYTISSENSQVVNSSPAGTLDITGTPSVGSFIYATKNFTTPDVYDWPSKQRTYVWFRNGIEIPNSSKTGNSYTDYVSRYTVQTEDFGSQISVSITYTDDRGYEETITAAAVSIVGSTATGLSISGVNEVSGTIAADLSSFYDPDISSDRFYQDLNGNTQTAVAGKPIPTEILYRWKIVEDDLFVTPEGNQYESLLVQDSYYGKTVELSIKYPDELNEGVTKTSTAQTTIVNSEPVGNIEITGSVVGVRLPLTLSVDQISDINGPYAEENANWDFNYSLSARKRDDFGNLQSAVSISNANGSMKGSQQVQYTVAPEYQNSIIIATVDYTDGEGVQHTLSDSIEIPAVGYPTIDGTIEAEQQVTLNTDEVENLTSIDSIKWYVFDGSDFQEISGETSNTYTVKVEDVEKYIKVEITYTTNVNDTETRSSVPVLVDNSIPVGTPRIENSGSFYAQGFAVGDVLSSSVEHIVDVNGVKQFYDYQWYRQARGHSFSIPEYQEDKTNLVDIDGATSQTYTITAEDQLKRIGYKVKLVDDLDKVHQLNSGLSWRRVDFQPTGEIKVKRLSDGKTTSAGINDTLAIDYSGYLDLDGLALSRNHVWKVDGVTVQTGTNKEYIVRTEDYQKQITVDITYSDRTNGDLRQISTTNNFVISDTPADGLYIQGNAIAGNTLTGDISLLNDPDGVPPEEQIQFQWYRDDVAIAGEATKSYSILRSDFGKTIKLQAQYTDGENNLETPEAAVIVGESTPSGSIKFSGSATLGSDLTLDMSEISDVYGPETQQEKDATLFSYAIQARNSNDVTETLSQGDIYGNETAKYTIKESDLGKSIFITATFLDGKGDQKTVTSTYVDENGDEQGPELYVPYPPDLAPDPDLDENGNLSSLSSYEGPIEATGAGLKTVKLLSNEYIIVYDTSGYNPDIQNFVITATAYNHLEPIYYKFYLLTSDGSDILIPKGPSDTNSTRSISTSYEYFSSITYRVDTVEGAEDGDIIATDLVTIYGIKE